VKLTCLAMTPDANTVVFIGAAPNGVTDFLGREGVEPGIKVKNLLTGVETRITPMLKSRDSTRTVAPETGLLVTIPLMTAASSDWMSHCSASRLKGWARLWRSLMVSSGIALAFVSRTPVRTSPSMTVVPGPTE